MTVLTETLRPVVLSGAQQGVGTAASSGHWWARYLPSLEKLGADALSVIQADAQYIAAKADPPIEEWSEKRVRTGIVVGSVQSGKTANMLAVAAKLLDRRIDGLVVIAGTRVSLWIQTYERLLAQLDGSTPDDAWKRNAARALIPDPFDILGEVRVDPQRYFGGQLLKVRKAIRLGYPLVVVVQKEDDHLHHLARFLSQVWPSGALDSRQKPLRLVVLDDEADDASVLDASMGERVTPSYIQQLWGVRGRPEETRHPKLLATYIAYTATPQANCLQSSHNPLSPRHFYVALRTPADCGATSPRSLTYTERGGLRSYYCGGELFYERWRGGDCDLCVPTPFPSRRESEAEDEYFSRFRPVRWDMIGNALRAYFVAGAIRLLLAGRSLQALEGLTPLSRERMSALLPPPHTLLYHPSALREKHFQGAEDIARWSKARPGQEEQVEPLRDPQTGDLVLDADGLAARLGEEKALWRSWLIRFDRSVEALSGLPGGQTFPRLSGLCWDKVEETLRSEVFRYTKIRVLNSDPRASDRPRFEPVPADSVPDLVTPPPDVFSIFVAGNVLSRGLTLEGLCTSLFLRTAREPAADTQMQMQRWFGYRGRFLPLCRVFLFDDQLDLFRAYHANDEALKQEILMGMDQGGAPFRNGVLVLQGERYRATNKVTSERLPLHPGPTPSIRLVENEDGELAEANTAVLADLMEKEVWEDLEFPEGTLRGRISTRQLGLTEVAELLDQLRYTRHDPDPTFYTSVRWESLGRMLRLGEPLFRPPRRRSGLPAVDPCGCPYTVAAYLRLWNAVLATHDAPGLYPTDAPEVPWHLVDLDAYRRTAPMFYIGVRFGDEGVARHPRLASLRVRAMKRTTVPGRPWLLETLWGTRGRGGLYLGDQFFDYHKHHSTPLPHLHNDEAWRRRGHPGQVLFHVVRDERGNEVIAVGLALPQGGPDHVAALRQPQP